MRTWKFVAWGLLGLALSGCRNDPAVAILERDNRQKEDEIYRLRWRVEELEDQLQDCPAQANRPPRVRSSDDLPPERPTEAPARRREAPPRDLPHVQTERPKPQGQSAPSGNGDSSGIDVQIPEQPLPSGQIPDRLKPIGPSDGTPPSSTPAGTPGETAPAAPGSGPALLPGASPGSSAAPGAGSGWFKREVPSDPVSSSASPSSRVAQITLNDSMTGGVGSPMTLSDRGLLVVIEPRDLTGNIIDAPGDVSAVLLDTAFTGEASRIGRWEFTAAETSALLRPEPDHGIHLTLPWAAGPPEHSRLKLFVRYTTQDGRKLQVERSVVVALARDAAPQRQSPPLSQFERSPAEPERTATRPRKPVWTPERTY